MEGIAMSTKKTVEKKEKKLTENDIIKYEIAEELGLLDKVNANGWKSLTARESGRIGGLLAKRKKKNKETSETAPIAE